MDEDRAIVILVDSSVWIAYLRGLESRATRKLELAFDHERILVGDVILLGFFRAPVARRTLARSSEVLRRFEIVSLLGAELAVRAARNYRKLRAMGMVRKTPDVIIGTY